MELSLSDTKTLLGIPSGAWPSGDTHNVRISTLTAASGSVLDMAANSSTSPPGWRDCQFSFSPPAFTSASQWRLRAALTGRWPSESKSLPFMFSIRPRTASSASRTRQEVLRWL
eukprot:1390313-Rhodomonas_salina.3